MSKKTTQTVETIPVQKLLTKNTMIYIRREEQHNMT